jgi:hypothetical protein
MIWLVLLFQLSLAQDVNVSKSVTANITVSFSVWGVQYISKGVIVVDAINNGLYLSIYGDNPQTPFRKMNLTLVVHPSANESVSIWEVDTGVCTFEGDFNSSKIPPLTIPPTAKYVGKRDVRGLNCDVWRMNNPYKGIDYCEVMIANYNIQLVEGYYSGGALGAYFYINVFDQNNNPPALERFAVPKDC